LIDLLVTILEGWFGAVGDQVSKAGSNFGEVGICQFKILS